MTVGSRNVITNTNIGQACELETKDPDSRALENFEFVYTGQKKKKKDLGWGGENRRIGKVTPNTATAIEASV